MSSDQGANPLNSLRKAQEEEYFLKKNAEAAEKLKAFQALKASGVKDESLVKLLLEAGFDSDRVRALFLQPLVEVAWADGRVQSEEKELILQFANERKISEDSEAYKVLLNWIDKGPKDQSFLQAKALLEPLMLDKKAGGKDDPTEWIMKSVEDIAEITNTLFGFGFRMVSKEEKDFIQSLSARLKK